MAQSTTAKRTQVHEIRDSDGHLIARHYRREHPDGKRFSWRLPDGTWSLNGLKLEDLPLYGAHLIRNWNQERPIVVVEGEKACDTLLGADIPCVATVTGAASTPGCDALTVLRGREVILWPDNDEGGRRHMEVVAEKLQSIAELVRIYTWHDAPEKGDAADHPAIASKSKKRMGMLLNDLLGSPEWKVPIHQQESSSTNGYHANSKAKNTTAPTHDELRDRFIEQHPAYAYGLGEWRYYEDGTWTPVSELTVKQQIAEVIDAAKVEGIRPTGSLLSSVTELIRVKVYVPDALWDADPHILVCQNGVLNIPSRELREHRPDDYATNRVPYEYDPEAVADIWLAAINTTVPDAADFLQEFAGYALTIDTSLETAVWLAGPRGSGKSTILTGLQTMLGARAGVLGLADVERNRFALANLPGKSLVVATEQPSNYISSTHLLNAIISGEPIQVERKYRDAYTIIPKAKVAWAMNDLPRVADANSGLFRRVKVIKFPELPEERRNPSIKEAISKEGAGILNWALDGLERLRTQMRFEVPGCVASATAHFQETNDVVAMFVEEMCMNDKEEREQAAKLYKEYRFWCDENGHRALSSTRMASEWERLGFIRVRTKKGTVYEGVRLRLPSE